MENASHNDNSAHASPKPAGGYNWMGSPMKTRRSNYDASLQFTERGADVYDATEALGDHISGLAREPQMGGAASSASHKPFFQI